MKKRSPIERREVVPFVCTATKRDGTTCTRYAGTVPPRLCPQHDAMAKREQEK